MPGDLDPGAIRSALTTGYIGRHLVVVDCTTSTMDLAASEAAKAVPEGTVVVAEKQTAGRGRFGRPWISPKGAALYVSIILRPPPELLPGVNMATPIAVVQAAKDVAVLEADIKWPNDVQVAGRKLAGILVDATTGIGSASERGHVIVGVGLNVSLDVALYPELIETATSLEWEAGHDVPRLGVLVALLRRFEALYDRLKSGESLLQEWRERINVIGRQVRIVFPNSPGANSIEGVVMDVDNDAALVLRRDDGSIERIFAGEVSLR